MLEILMTMQKSALDLFSPLFLHNFHLTMNWQCCSRLNWLGIEKISVIAMNWFDFTGALAYTYSDYTYRVFKIRFPSCIFIGLRRLCHTHHHRCHYRNTNDVNAIFLLHFLPSSSFVWCVFRCYASTDSFLFKERKMVRNR